MQNFFMNLEDNILKIRTWAPSDFVDKRKKKRDDSESSNHDSILGFIILKSKRQIQKKNRNNTKN